MTAQVMTVMMMMMTTTTTPITTAMQILSLRNMLHKNHASAKLSVRVLLELLLAPPTTVGKSYVLLILIEIGFFGGQLRKSARS